MNTHSTKGEISSIITIFSFIIIIFGVILGSHSTIRNSVYKLFSKAQTNFIPVTCIPTSSGCSIKLHEVSLQTSISKPSMYTLSGKLCLDNTQTIHNNANIWYSIKLESGSFPYATDQSLIQQNLDKIPNCNENGSISFVTHVKKDNFDCSTNAKIFTHLYIKNNDTSPLQELVSSEYAFSPETICESITPTPTPTQMSQNSLCNYHATATVRLNTKNGTILTKSQNNNIEWGISNDKQLIKNPNTIAHKFSDKNINTHNHVNYYNNYAIAPYHNNYNGFKPSDPNADYALGDFASVSLLGLDTTKWKIIGIYCNSLSNTSSCPEQFDPNTTEPIIRGFPMKCDFNAEYGWIIEEISQISPTLSPSTTITPTSQETLTPSPSTTITPTQAPCQFHPISTIELQVPKSEHYPDLNDGNWGTINNKYLESYGNNRAFWSRFVQSGNLGVYDPCYNARDLEACTSQKETCCGPVGNMYKIQQPGGDIASVTLNYDSTNYIITDQCFTDLSTPGDKICTEVQDKTDPHIFKNLPVACGKSYIYTWKLKSKTLLTPTITPTVTSTLTPTTTILPSTTSTPTPTPNTNLSCMKNRGCSPNPIEGWERLCKLEGQDLSYYCCPENYYGNFKCVKSCPEGQILIKSTQTCEPISPLLCKSVTSRNINNISHRVLLLTEKTNQNDFDKEIEQAMLKMNNTDLGALLSKIEFIKYDRADIEFDCGNFPVNDISGGNGITCTLHQNIDKLLSVCNANSSVIFTNLSGRSSASWKYVSMESFGTNAFHHELGHSIAQLMDEYPVSASDALLDEKPWGINCTSDTTCASWKAKYPNIIDCEKGCYYPNWSRPKINSAMYYGENNFYDVSLEQWKTILGDVIPPTNLNYNAVLNSKQFLSLNIAINQHDYEKVSIANIAIVNAYPQDSNTQTNDKGYKISILDNTNKTINEQFIPAYNKSYDMGSNQNLLLNKNISIYMPYSNQAKTILVKTTEGKEIERKDISSTIKITPIPPTSLCGNSVCDTIRGENSSSCAKDCAPEATHVDIKIRHINSDLNKDNYINTLDYATSIKHYAEIKTIGMLIGDINKDGKVNAADISIILQNLNTKIPEI